jgi:hypothetical protein
MNPSCRGPGDALQGATAANATTAGNAERSLWLHSRKLAAGPPVLVERDPTSRPGLPARWPWAIGFGAALARLRAIPLLA